MNDPQKNLAQDLRRIADEIRLKIHLASMDAKTAWASLEPKVTEFERTVDTMFDKVAQLQRPPFHPKWKEMAPRATVSGWTRFKSAQEWLDRNMPLPANAAVSSASGAATPPAVAAPAAALAPQDPLYREFLEWRASRAKASTNR